MTDRDEAALLDAARAWKRGELRPVHPTIGRMLNQALHRAGEDPVPFRRATFSQAASLADLIRGEYARAPGHTDDRKPTPSLNMMLGSSVSVHQDCA